MLGAPAAPDTGAPPSIRGFTSMGSARQREVDHYWISRIGDPGFRYHALMVSLWGAMALRLANAEVHPFDFDAQSAALRDFVRRLEEIDGASAQLDLRALVDRVVDLRRAARRLALRLDAALSSGAVTPEAADRLNARLRAFEQNWLRSEGIPGRPWFRHLLYAPRYTYAAMTLPGITEAAEEADWSRARAQAALLAEAIARNAALLDEASAGLEAPTLGPLEERLQRIREGFDGRMAIYASSLPTGETVAIDADSTYETFSVIKVPIMAAVLQRVKEGRLALGERVTLRLEQRRIPSGVLYALDPGLRPTLHDLLTLMTIVSDNVATDALADLVGREAVTRQMEGLGLRETRIRFSDLDWDRLWLRQLDPDYGKASGDRTIEFPFERYPSARVSEAFRRVIEESGLYFGRSTARETGLLFSLMARGELVSKEASDLMVSILKRQQVDDRFPRYLGDGIVVAHKTGDGQPWVGNDAGILWVRGQPIVLVVFTGHHRGSTAALHDAVARVAAEVVHHFGGEVSPAGLAR